MQPFTSSKESVKEQRGLDEEQNPMFIVPLALPRLQVCQQEGIWTPAGARAKLG